MGFDTITVQPKNEATYHYYDRVSILKNNELRQPIGEFKMVKVSRNWK